MGSWSFSPALGAGMGAGGEPEVEEGAGVAGGPVGVAVADGVGAGRKNWSMCVRGGDCDGGSAGGA